MHTRTLINNEIGFEGEPKSDFEKLIIAEKVIKALHFQSGIMESEAAELVDKCKALNAKIGRITAATREERLAIKIDTAVFKEKNKLRKLELIIRDLRRNNSELVSQVIKLQEANNGVV